LINPVILGVTAEPFDPTTDLAGIGRFARHRLQMTAFALDDPGHHAGQGIQMPGLVAGQLFRVKLH
jgi:hypothetical protein